MVVGRIERREIYYEPQELVVSVVRGRISTSINIVKNYRNQL